jgi:hypothetical protein
VALRAELAPDQGADNIHAALLTAAGQPDRPAGMPVPARATINRILGRQDLLARNPRKRPKSSYRRFAYARPVPHLTDAERALYGQLIAPDCARHRRVEQERIPLDVALDRVRRLGVGHQRRQPGLP